MPLPSPMPNRNMAPDTYIAAWNTLLAALPTFETDVNTKYSAMGAMASGAGFTIPYTYGTISTVGFVAGTQCTLTPNGGAQTAATALYLDTSTAIGNVASLLATFDDSSSIIKGYLRLTKISDPTRWLIIPIVAGTASTYYYAFNVNGGTIAGSHASPFVVGDALVASFVRTGDIGTTGTLQRRVSAGVVTNTSHTPNIANTDMFSVIGINAASVTFNAPSGTPTDGQSLVFRLVDNGTSRPLAWNAVYRAGTDLPMPTVTTSNKWLYIGFIYNGPYSKWDLVSVLNNIDI